jgi:hypothetical protein
MSTPATTASWVAQLCQPYEGARFLHGRAWPVATAGGGAAPLTLYASQQTEQHDCMIADGSQLQYDVGLIDHAGGRELRVDGVVKSGGSLIALGVVPGGEAGDARLAFAPDTLHVDADAARLARRLFPELLASMAAAGVDDGELLLVQGTLTVTTTARGAASAGGVEGLWRPLSTGGSGSVSAVPSSSSAAAAGASSSSSSSAAAPSPPLPGTVAELLARDWEGTNVHVHPGMVDGDSDGGQDAGGAGGCGASAGGHDSSAVSALSSSSSTSAAAATPGGVPRAHVTDDVQLLPPSLPPPPPPSSSAGAAAGGGAKRAAVDADGWITTKRTAARLGGGGGGST